MYALSNVTRVTQSSRMRLAGNVARRVELRNALKFSSENLKGGD
jgi:hypothetical protein